MNGPQMPKPVLSLIALVATGALVYNMYLTSQDPAYNGDQFTYALVTLIATLCGVQYVDFRRKGDDDEDQNPDSKHRGPGRRGS